MEPDGPGIPAGGPRCEKVPVAVHLDHGRSIETCIRAVREGFTSVMFDGAELPFEENAEQTRLVVRLAHAAGVDVEAELGRVGDTGFGGEGTAAAAADVFTDVEESARSSPEPKPTRWP